MLAAPGPALNLPPGHVEIIARYCCDILLTCVYNLQNNVFINKQSPAPHMPAILVINGPNLNLLGHREPQHYGATGLAQIEADLAQAAARDKVGLAFFQSNAEHELINRVQAAQTEGIEFIIINPAAFTHTSIALRDALLATAIPFIELHLSNVHAREEFRRHSYFSDVAVGVICGLGAMGYQLAYQAARAQIESQG